jgi:hypothetical protein
MSQGVDLSSPERAIPAPVGFASFASPVSVRCLRKAREHGVCEKLGDTPSARSSGTRHLRKAWCRTVTGKSNETHGWRLVSPNAV